MRIFILLLLHLSLSKNSLKTHSSKNQHKLHSNQDAKPSTNATKSFTIQNNLNKRRTQMTQTNQTLLTNMLPNESGDGKHSFKQIHNIFKSRSMSFMEIKSIFQQMDTNNDNFISDYDWIQFYNLFLDPFQKCLKSEDYTLSPQDLLECIGNSSYLHHLEHLSTLAQIETLLFNLNNNVLTLHDYIWLRRVNKAYQDCADNLTLAPNKIYCALKITSPRTARMSPVQEKSLFQVAVRLMDGYENGLRSGLLLEEFVLIAHIYHEFNEFELSKENTITLNDALRATQENMFHMRYIPLYANYIFNGYQNQEMTLTAWIGSMWSLMVFQYATEQQFMTFEQFMSVIEKKRLPQRLIDTMNNTIIPDIGTYEIASQRLFTNVTENEYFTQTNNILFLQKKNKLKLKDIHTNFQSHQPQQHHQNLVKQSSEINNTDIYEQQFEEPQSGFEIIFNQFDRFQNKSIHVQDWMNLIRYSFLYMYYDNQGVQQLTSENINKNDGFQTGPQNPFPLKLTDEHTFIQFIDFLSENPTFQITFKQFTSYFNYNSICEFLTQPGFDLQASFMRTEQCLHLLGFRVSQHNRLEGLKGFDGQLNEQSMNYALSYQVAIKEDIVAVKILRNDKKVFVNQDLNMADQKEN